MSATDPIDEDRLALLPGDLRLPTIKRIRPRGLTRRQGGLVRRALPRGARRARDRLGRAPRRIERHLAEARLPPDKTPDKTPDTFAFGAVPFVGQTVPRTVC